MTLEPMAKLGLIFKKAKICIQKIDNLMLENYGIVLAKFLL